VRAIRALIALSAATIVLILDAPASQARDLRVCADPNNLPFSNERGEGFENKIAELIAKRLDARLSYVWWAQHRGFIRKTLNDGLCDLVTGTTNGIDMLRTTRPYYRSGFAFVTRPDGPVIASLDDPQLHRLRIGIQLVGLDGSNPPPSEALAKRGIVDNVRGYMVYGDYRDDNPAAGIMKAVANGDIDVHRLGADRRLFRCPPGPTAARHTRDATDRRSAFADGIRCQYGRARGRSGAVGRCQCGAGSS